MIDPKKWQPIIVEWEDALTSHAPHNSRQYIKTYKPMIRKSIGFLLGRTEEHIHISATDDRSAVDYDDSDDITTIPIGMIRKVSFLTSSETP